MSIQMSQDRLGEMIMGSESFDQRYVAVPRRLLDAVEGARYPDWLLDMPLCATDPHSGGWWRSYDNAVDLLCTLQRGHDGDHGWAGVAGTEVEGVLLHSGQAFS